MEDYTVPRELRQKLPAVEPSKYVARIIEKNTTSSSSATAGTISNDILRTLPISSNTKTH